MEHEYPTEDEIRRVLHTLCVYAYDNHASFQVIAHGVDGVGDGSLQFGVNGYPEDLRDSSFEQLVKRLSAYNLGEGQPSDK